MRIQSISSVNFRQQANTQKVRQEPIQNNQIYGNEIPFPKWLLPLEVAGIVATLLIGFCLMKR